MSTARKAWVDAKAKAAVVNGGKDVWKDNKLKSLGLGPALDAYDAAEDKFTANDTKFDEHNATRPAEGSVHQARHDAAQVGRQSPADL